MKKLVVLFMVLVIALTASGQNTRWYYNYNNGADDEGKDIVYGADGYLYAAGISSDGSKNDIVVVKLNKAGEQQWVYRYPEASNSSIELVNEIIYGADNNIYFCGMQEDASGNGEFLVVSITTEGSYRWHYVFDSGPGIYGEAYSVILGDDGQVYACGVMDYDYFVVGLNSSDGEQVWKYQLDGGCPYILCDDEASGLVYGGDGNLYVTGHVLSLTAKQLLTVCLRPSDGYENWKYLHPFSDNVGSAGIDILYGKDGRLYMCGVKMFDNGMDIMALCLNTAGQYQWDYSVDGPGPEPSFGEICYEMLWGIDDNLYIVGRFAGRDAITDTDLDVAVISVTPSGECRWAYRYEGLYLFFDMAFSIVQTPDTNIHVAGYFCGLFAEAGAISLHHQTGRPLWVFRYFGYDASMDAAYALTADDNGRIYVTGYDYDGGGNLYVWGLDPPRHTDGWYDFDEYGTAGCGYSIIRNRDNDYVTAGFKSIANNWTSRNMLLMKTDINAEPFWQKEYGGSSEEVAYSVAQTNDDGYILCGYTESYGAGGSDIYLVKTDAGGTMEWEKTIGYAEDETAHSVDVTDDGGYIIAGTSTHKEGGSNIWIIKTDAAGDTIWTRWFGGTKTDRAGAIRQTDDNGYIFIGSLGVPSGVGYQMDIYVIRMDPDGDTVWTKTFAPSETGDEGSDILQLDDGSFAGTGYYEFQNYIFKLTPDGELDWGTLSGSGYVEGFNSVCENPAGGFYTTEYCNNGWHYHFGITHFDSEGHETASDTAGWCGNIPMPTMGSAFDIVSLPEGGYMATGEGVVSGENSNAWNLIIFRKGGTLTPLPPLGIFDPGHGNNRLPQQIVNYPNPFSGTTRIDFKVEHHSFVNLAIFDMQGKRVAELASRSMAPGEYSFEWDAAGQVNTLFFARLQIDGRTSIAKMVLLK
jgi:hypothetical protein